MKIRGLDCFYFKVKRDDKWYNLCFTDLTDEEANNVIRNRSDEWLIGLYNGFKDTLYQIVDGIDTSTLKSTVDSALNSMDNFNMYSKVIGIRAIIRNIGDFFDLEVGSDEDE